MMDLQQFGGEDAMARRYDYDEDAVVVVDLGPATDDGVVDLVDGTAIVVVGDEQYEVEVPAGASRAFMENGVLTVEVEG